MRNPGGYAIWTDPDLPTVERDTITCCHCNTVVFIAPRADPSAMGGFCLKCMKHTCAKCADSGVCTPWEKQMERAEADITARIERDRAIDKMLKDSR